MTFVILKVRKKLTRTFKELGLSAEILKALEENRFKMPFPIQEGSYTLYFERYGCYRAGTYGNW